VGMKRATFTVGSRWVVKVPLSWEGVSENCYEAQHTDPGVPLAACRLHVSIPSGLPLLWMERVDPVTWSRNDPRYPAWADWVDCGQIGLTTDGRLVAYDL
jgi:hypothetical protein